jgi:hypothetical protein
MLRIMGPFADIRLASISSNSMFMDCTDKIIIIHVSIMLKKKYVDELSSAV